MLEALKKRFENTKIVDWVLILVSATFLATIISFLLCDEAKFGLYLLIIIAYPVIVFTIIYSIIFLIGTKMLNKEYSLLNLILTSLISIVLGIITAQILPNEFINWMYKAIVAAYPPIILSLIWLFIIGGVYLWTKK